MCVGKCTATVYAYRGQFSSPMWILGVEFSSSHLGAGALVHWALHLVFLTQSLTESGAHLFCKTWWQQVPRILPSQSAQH